MIKTDLAAIATIPYRNAKAERYSAKCRKSRKAKREITFSFGTEGLSFMLIALVLLPLVMQMLKTM